MKKSLGATPIAIPSPVWMIGSYSADATANLMVASWCGICSSNPPCIALSVKQSRLTYQNIIEHDAFTVNIPSQDQVCLVDYVGTMSGKDEAKFIATGLTSVKSELVDAPYVKECAMNIECKLIHAMDIGIHTQFIGQIVDVKADKRILDGNLNPSVKKLKPIIASASDRSYYAVGEYIGQVYHIGNKRVNIPQNF